MKYDVCFSAGTAEEARRWWNSLPSSQKREYIELELYYWNIPRECSKEGGDQYSIMADWIEEHGGERDWCIGISGVIDVRSED